MKQLSFIIRKSYIIVAVVTLSMCLTSCGFMEDFAQGMASYPTYPAYGYGRTNSYSTGYGTGYSTGYSTNYVSTTSSSSSSSSHRNCSRCSGNGHCKTCGGSGKKYDYGSMSIVTHDKYVQRCGVCNGTGKCGVCNGKGRI